MRSKQSGTKPDPKSLKRSTQLHSGRKSAQFRLNWADYIALLSVGKPRLPDIVQVKGS